MIDEEIQTLLKKYDRPAPRYTSFPTAVQFHDGYGPADVDAALAAVPCDKPVSVYVHIPFCHSLCHYCGCHTKIVHESAPIEAYVDTLCEEIRICAQRLRAKPKISRLHFGGGSPNYAPVDSIEKIIAALKDHFDADAGFSIDMECDPRLLNAEKIRAYARLGVRRVSLGIQDFDAQVQDAINRVQPYEQVADCVMALRDAGIHSINFDLIAGLPKQTHDGVQRTMDQAIALKPDRVAVFAYAHVPWMKKHQKLLEAHTLPDADSRYELMQAMRARLLGAGYAAIGIDHYALPDDALPAAAAQGNLRRNFQGYTDDTAETILGYGLSAISQFRDAYAQNTTDVQAYRRAIAQGVLPVQRGLSVSARDRRIRDLIMEIMCGFTVDLVAYADIDAPREQLAALEEDGLIHLRGSQIKVTERGMPFTRLVAACFDPYFNQAAQRHARAI